MPLNKQESTDPVRAGLVQKSNRSEKFGPVRSGKKSGPVRSKNRFRSQKKIKNSIFYKTCNLVINRHLLRRINSSLPQWKSSQKTVQDTMVKSPKIEMFEHFENPHPGKSCFSWKFQCFLMELSFDQQIRCSKTIFDTDFSSRIDW